MDPDTLIAKAAESIRKAPPMFNELGVSRDQSVGATLYDDFIPQLSGNRALRVYREMTQNDATIGAICYAMEMLIRSADWQATPDDPMNPGDVEAAEFLTECIAGLEHTWADFIGRAISFLPYGFALHEIVLTPRGDGRVGWRSFSPRPQATIDGPVWGDDGRLAGYAQQVRFDRVFLPVEKLLVFRTDSTLPSGRSILRNSYVSWFYKKRATELLLIGLDRDLSGMPVAWIPADSLIKRDAIYDVWKDLVTRSKRDEQMGWVLPQAFDPDTGNKMFEFEIVRGESGASIGPTRDVIRMLATDIATTVLAEFIALGRDTVGSRALAEPKQELFQTTMEAWADVMEAEINRSAVDQLLTVNGMAGATIRHGPIKDANLADLGAFMQQTGATGIDWTDSDAVNRVRQMAGFEPLPEAGQEF